MKKSRNYLTVDELQGICERLGLATDGLKTDLIQRILESPSARAPTDEFFDAVDSHSSTTSRVVLQRMKTVPIIENLSTKPSIDLPISVCKVNLSYKSWYTYLIFFVAIIVIVGGFISFFEIFRSEEKFEIPIRRSLFF